MARPARSATPLDVTQGVALDVPMTLYNPGVDGADVGTPIDLTGATVTALARWSNIEETVPCTVVSRTGGKFKASLSAGLTARLPARGQRGVPVAELLIVVADALGGQRHYILSLEVWPL